MQKRPKVPKNKDSYPRPDHQVSQWRGAPFSRVPGFVSTKYADVCREKHKIFMRYPFHTRPRSTILELRVLFFFFLAYSDNAMLFSQHLKSEHGKAISVDYSWWSHEFFALCKGLTILEDHRFQGASNSFQQHTDVLDDSVPTLFTFKHSSVKKALYLKARSYRRWTWVFSRTTT